MNYQLGVVAIWLLGSAVVTAQQPSIQNGAVRTLATTTVDGAVRSVGTSSEPLWIGWRAPMVNGGPRQCSSWSDGDVVVRGLMLEPRGGDGRPQLNPAAGPLQLEAGTEVVVLLRIVEARVERLRVASDDCPIDANGLTVTWLSSISSSESLRYLNGLAQPSSLSSDARQLAQAAATAIALHRDGTADTLLSQIATSSNGSEAAWRLLAAYRGRRGVEQLTTAIATEPDPPARQRLVAALRLSSEPEATATLLSVAKGDASDRVRAEAIQGYVSLAGSAGLPQVLEVATSDASPEVQSRAVSSLTRLPPRVSVPALLSLARTSPRLPVRKAAVTALARTDDPRATAYLEELVTK